MVYKMKRFEYFAPEGLEEALLLLLEYKGRAKVLAGGTDLLVKMKEGKVTPTYLIGLARIPGLDYIRQDKEGGLRIGALTTHQSIADSDLLKGSYELLSTACRKIGSPQIRNMGTIGGNLCNGGPSADSAPPLLVLEAKLNLVSARGQREVSLDKFFSSPFQTVMEEDELLTEIKIPLLPARTGSSYQWLTKVTSVDETLVGVAVLVVMGDKDRIVKDIRIALCSVAPVPMRAGKAEKIMRGKEIEDEQIEEAAKLAVEEIMPRSRADYRTKMSAVLLKRAIKEAITRIKNRED